MSNYQAMSTSSTKASKGTATKKLKTILKNLEYLKSAVNSKLNPEGKEVAWTKIKPCSLTSKCRQFFC